jgi:hypothetical protein
MPYLGWTEDLYGHVIGSGEQLRLEKWRNNLRAKRARITKRLGEIRRRLAKMK